MKLFDAVLETFLLFELVFDVAPDGLLVHLANCLSIVAWRPEFPSPEVLLLELGVALEHLLRRDALERADAIGDRRVRGDGHEHVHVVFGDFDLEHLHVVVMGSFDEDLLEGSDVGFLEGLAPVLRRPDEMVFQPVDVVLSPVQLHALASLAPFGSCAIHRGGRAPAVSAALAKTSVQPEKGLLFQMFSAKNLHVSLCECQRYIV